jgi:predicted DNA-binding antitoxin AbrB/MazE fold protein
MTYQGHVENGVVMLDEAVKLAEGARVRVQLVETAAESLQEDEGPTLYEQFKSFIGTASGLPADMAQNHDHYLHGRPKR